MIEFSRGNYEQKSRQILEATRGLSSTDLEGTHLIECLRSHLKVVTEEMERLRKERDEARRMACEKEETLGCDERGVPRNGSARDHAKQRGWDCFKENS
jgi:hypothetical protein